MNVAATRLQEALDAIQDLVTKIEAALQSYVARYFLTPREIQYTWRASGKEIFSGD